MTPIELKTFVDDVRRAAHNSLDGMKYNREKLAKDTLKLCQIVEAQGRRLEELRTKINATPPEHKGLFGDMFGDIFGPDLKKGK